MISYTITACNESSELEKLLFFLKGRLGNSDEIVLQLDKENVTPEVMAVVNRYQNQITALKVIEFSLNNDFASFKNNLKQHCQNEWIFNIDADEVPSGFLIENIQSILSANSELDVILVPRWNTVDGITEEHIKTWGWRLDDYGRINWPDWQMRIYKNKEEISWKNKVHEQLYGFDRYSHLPEDKDYCLFHNKTITKQEHQNSFYNNMA